MSLFTVISTIFLILRPCVYSQKAEDFLPRNVKPIRYNLGFEVLNLTNFQGSAIIEIEALENTNNITLHANSLNIHQDSINVVDLDGNIIQCVNSSTEEDKDFYVIHLEDYLQKHAKYNITIDKFYGTLENTKYGFYTAEYLDKDNTKRYLTVTQFEPMYARKAFPCFDEPRLKATFIINLIRPAEKISASNMPLLETIDLGNNRYQDIYQESVLMSTYIVAFVICEYKYSNINGIVRFLAPPQYVDDGSLDYTLLHSNNILSTLEKFTDLKYALPKLDLVAINRKYSVDGMENYGLVTFSEQHVLCPNTSSTNQFQTCFTFLVHEFAHQWFGNLATPKTWHYMWLSEGFACYFQYHMSHKIKPEWRLDEQFVTEVRVATFGPTSEGEPVNYIFTGLQPIPSPEIAYSKAASIIRMTSYFLTQDVFEEGLRLYLKKNQFKSTTPEDLYSAYEVALKNANQETLLGNLTVIEILSTWNNIPGNPIVTVTRDYKTGSVTFNQKNSLNEYDDSVWNIPLTYVFQQDKENGFNQTTTDLWFTEKNRTLHSNISEGWLIVNKFSVGVYVVNYDEQNWKRIIAFLKSEDYHFVPPLNRAQLINDAFYLVKQNELSYEILFNLTTYLQQETDYIPISSFLLNLGVLDHSTVQTEAFKSYLMKLLNTSYSQLGLKNRDGDSHTDKLLRNKLIARLCSEDQQCEDFGLEMLETWKNTGIYPIIGDLDVSILCTAMHQASFDKFIRKEYLLNNTNNDNCFKLLLCPANETETIIVLDFLFDLTSSLTANDRVEVINKILENDFLAKYTVLDYLINLEDDIRYETFFANEQILILLSLKDERKYATQLKKRVHKIPVLLLQDEDEETNLGSQFITWYQKYFNEHFV